MQKAPVMKGSGLMPLDDGKSNEEVHVFGKNLEERVVTQDEDEEPIDSIKEFSFPSKIDEDIDSIRKRKFDLTTGEEDEETVFQGDFKLFIWDLPTSNWVEKGSGQLKLNDSVKEVEKKSRLIMRVSGTLRIILNVAVDRSHFKVIANSKNNIRFTDSQTVWAARGSNATQLKDLLEERLKKRPQPEIEDQAPSKRTKARDEEDKVGDVDEVEDADEEEEEGGDEENEAAEGEEDEGIEKKDNEEEEDKEEDEKT